MTKPEKAWAAVLGQLQHNMPKAAFETWVRDTKFVSFEEGLFTVGVANDYAREWLTSTVVRLLTGILNQNVDVVFIVYSEYFVEEEIENGGENKESIGFSLDNPDELSLQAEFKSIYDEIVQPDRVIVFRGFSCGFSPFWDLSWPGCISVSARLLTRRELETCR
jgi:chromosomal replication initiation ATPase DnaA